MHFKIVSVFFALLLSCAIIESSKYMESECSPGQELGHTDCVGCSPTCENPEASYNCSLVKCPVGCVCPEGKVPNPDALNGEKCISAEDCPECPENERYDLEMRGCNGCEPTCENPVPAGCTEIACHTLSCTCKDGLVRNKKGKCVPLEHCHKKKHYPKNF